MEYDCDLCGSGEHMPIDVARPYIGDNEPPVVCMKCGFIYVRERRSSAEVAKSWDDIWGDGYTSEWPAVKARLFYVAEWLDQAIGFKGKTLLDIGAGEGTFLKMARERGADVTGLEPSLDNANNIAVAGISCWNVTIEEAEGIGNFDIVTILWTLENCADCTGMLKRARELLKPDGVVVVATGSRILVPFKKPLSKYFSDNPADTHCFRFSAKTLNHVMVLSGFNRVSTNGLHYEDSDWLVMMAHRISDELWERSAHVGWPYEMLKDPDGLRDNQHEILNFFESWSEQFP